MSFAESVLPLPNRHERHWEILTPLRWKHLALTHKRARTRCESKALLSSDTLLSGKLTLTYLLTNSRLRWNKLAASSCIALNAALKPSCMYWYWSEERRCEEANVGSFTADSLAASRQVYQYHNHTADVWNKSTWLKGYSGTLHGTYRREYCIMRAYCQ